MPAANFLSYYVHDRVAGVYISIFNFFLRDLQRHFYYFTAQVRQLRLREIKQLFQHHEPLSSRVRMAVESLWPHPAFVLRGGASMVPIPGCFSSLFSRCKSFSSEILIFFTEETAITMTSKGFTTSRERTDKTIEGWCIQPDTKARVQLLISTNCTWEIYYTSINFSN